jgi:hypothetical protein
MFSVNMGYTPGPIPGIPPANRDRDFAKNMPRYINALAFPISLNVFSKFGEYSMGMKKQLQAAALHKSAQIISNVAKYVYPIVEHPPQYVESETKNLNVEHRTSNIEHRRWYASPHRKRHLRQAASSIGDYFY